MNFKGRMEGQQIHIDLKYCERCGGLWLRPRGAIGVYCASCQVSLKAMPDPGAAPLRKARRRKPRLQGTSPARIDSLQGVAVMEVWA